MLRRILGPFLPTSGASRRTVALWAILVLGAPIAVVSAYYLQKYEAARRRLTVTVTRAQALSIAETQARELQLDVRGWKEYVSFDYNEDLAMYAHSRQTGGPPGGRRGMRRGQPPSGQRPPGPPPDAAAPPVPPPDSAERKGDVPPGGPEPRRGPPPSGITEVRVVLVDPAGNRYFRVRLNSRGRLVGWQLGGTGAAENAPPAPPEVAKELAEAGFAKWLGEQEAERHGEPEMERTERAAGASGYRFVWRARNPRLPDTEYVVTAQVQGNRLISLEATLEFSEAYMEQVVQPRNTVSTTFTILRVLLIIACVGYACWRYTRRWIEGEAPHLRMAGLAAAFTLLSAAVYFLDSTFAAPQIDAALNQPGVSGVILISTIAMFLLMGLMLGISYGSGEGEIREGFPGKMTATDCLLTGRFFNRNVGRAVLTGAAVTSWCFLLMSIMTASIQSEPPHVPEQQMAFAFGRFPLLLLLFNVPVGGIFVVVSGLLLPLTFLRRHVRNRRLLLALMVVGALLGSNLNETPTQGYWNYTAEVVPLAIALLASFFLADVLASVVACAGLNMLSLSSDLAALVPYWRDNEWLIWTGCALPLLALGAGAWSSREYEEEDVRPSHAANLASRLKLQAELSAARHAQLRLMPDGPPDIPGLSIAASCTPAREVSGDFYDFLPVAGGRLAVVIGEGGNDGLASALTIALTKGYLLYRTQQSPVEFQNPRALLMRIDRVLGSMLRRESGHTSLALVRVDPQARTCAMARIGAWPQVLLLRANGTVEELTDQDRERSLEADDSLVILTDGIAKLLERSSGESPAEVLRRAAQLVKAEPAARLHDEFLSTARAAARASDTGDDITTVVLRLVPAEAGAGQVESAA